MPLRHDLKSASAEVGRWKHGYVRATACRLQFEGGRQASIGGAQSEAEATSELVEDGVKISLINDTVHIGSLIINICHQAIENLDHGVGNRLAECAAGFSNFLLVHIPRGKRKTRPMFRNDEAGAFNCPLNKISAIVDRDGFHGTHQN